MITYTLFGINAPVWDKFQFDAEIRADEIGLKQ